MGETTLGYLSETGCSAPATYLSFSSKPAHLASHHVDNLKYGYTDAFGYNKRRFGSTLEVALMEKIINGEKTA
ncbi:MAG: hypothetical protein NWE93_03965 [Candidatus Bathyarchaeota archaeon]|nr:hypothetical protein [Candidatus Bathyarchaeota archaeon]